MIPILTHPSGFHFGLADAPEEVRRARAIRLAVFTRAQFYRGTPEDDSDEYDTQEPFTFLIKKDGDIVGTARYVRGGRGFPLYKAFAFELPPHLAAVPEQRRVDGGKIAVLERFRGGLTSPGLICAAILYLNHTGAFDLSLHCTFDRWGQKILATGLAFHPIEGARLIYPSDGRMAPYYYESEPIRAYYGPIQANREPARRVCATLGLVPTHPFQG